MKNILKAIQGFFSSSMLKEFWETDKHGVIPEFPVIFYDKTYPHEIIVYDRVEYFYNEFIGDIPSKKEMIIDRKGRIFGLKYHDEKFNFPFLSDKIISIQELKQMLIQSEIDKLDIYLELESIEKIILTLKQNGH